MRLVAVLVLLAGCDGVLGLIDIHPTADAQQLDAPIDSVPGPCGMFTTITPVAFGASVAPYSNFSVDSTETHATIMTSIAGGKPAPHVLLLNAGVWQSDIVHDSLPTSVTWPVIATATEMFAAKPQTTGMPPYILAEYKYSTSWSEFYDLAGAPGYDALPTGYTQIGATETVVEIERYTTMDNVMLVRSGPGWGYATENPISQAGNTSGGALTSDGLVMVYAQSPSHTMTGSRLYVSRRTDVTADFPVGTPVVLSGSGEDVEPALAGDCSHLYFRRDQTIYVAR